MAGDKLWCDRKTIRDAENDELLLDFSDIQKEKNFGGEKYHEIMISKETTNFKLKIENDKSFMIIKILPKNT